MIGCVAGDMGITLLPRAAVARSEADGAVAIHKLSPVQAKVETLFIWRRTGHQYSALSAFVACLGSDEVIAA
jgi:DNA-binding transcriptional LysR family regulator